MLLSHASNSIIIVTCITHSGYQPGQESGGDFVTEEQLEVARNRAVQQASSRGKADRFVLSSATKLPPDSGPDTNPTLYD